MGCNCGVKTKFKQIKGDLKDILKEAKSKSNTKTPQKKQMTVKKYKT